MTKTKAELQNRIAQLKKNQKVTDEALRVAESLIKVTKGFSEIFCNTKTRELTKYENLSETKRYFEDNYLVMLQENTITEDGKLNSIEFHKMLKLY